MVTIGPRVYYAMAKNKAFFRAAASVDARWHTPVNAILSQGLCAMAMTLTPFPQLVSYIGFSLTLFTVLSVASRSCFAAAALVAAAARARVCLAADSGLLYSAGICMMVYGVVWQPAASLTAWRRWAWARWCIIRGSRAAD